MDNQKILNLAKELAGEIRSIDRCLLEDVTIKTKDIVIDLTLLDYWKNDKGIARYISKYHDDTVEAIIFCEGDLYEALYYYEANGSKDVERKALYSAFLKVLSNYEMTYEWDAGRIYLYEMKEDL